MGAGLSERQIYDRKRWRIQKIHLRLRNMGIVTTIKGTCLEHQGPRGRFQVFIRVLRASNAEVCGLPTLTSQIDGQFKKFEGFGTGEGLAGSFEQGMEYLDKLMGVPF